MMLSASHLADIEPKENLLLPDPAHLALPEKILQFGTGVLLRGLPDYFIDKANKNGIFNGRIVVVKSTSQNKASDFDEQDNLYTTCIRGIHAGKEINEHVVNAAISRVLSADSQWKEVIACAANPNLQIIISNTTEVGIALNREDRLEPGKTPTSFPGKMLAFLKERYEVFEGNDNSGMVILPTELITDNGTKLKEIVLELAVINNCTPDFIHWIGEANDFCNTLVDRIVPGALGEVDATATERYLGYQDRLMIMAEVYRLWAIETVSERSRDILSFSRADKGVVIISSIEKFKNLKLRLLNGAHTFSCGLAILYGFDTVKEAMADEAFHTYIRALMKEEIARTLIGDDISAIEAAEFSDSVIDRFANPFLEHKWRSICTNYSFKMTGRNIPTLLEWYRREKKAPERMALGFAAYILFHHQDFEAMNEALVAGILSDESVWGADLSTLPGFTTAVSRQLKELMIMLKTGVMPLNMSSGGYNNL